jgi:hypothetical protein
MVQMVELMPPPRGEPKHPEPGATLRFVSPGDQRIQYRIALPPEYHHHRSYPLLVVIPNSDQEPQDMMKLWEEKAAEYGYILVVPHCWGLLGGGYNYRIEEHDIIMSTIRDVRMRFNVDCSRTFLFGHIEGGTMAWDVGLSHPHEFAGILSMCCRPGKYSHLYWTNAQKLPFYVVEGEMNGTRRDDGNEYASIMRSVFGRWVPRGFPSLYVEYQGRGSDFFKGELSYMFEWMSKKRRVRSLSELGRIDVTGDHFNYQDFLGVRAGNGQISGDSRFYWLSRDERTTNSRMAARISEPNSIVFRIQGLPAPQRASIWLNNQMVDLEQPLELRLIMPQKRWKTTATTDVGVLLEDLYKRADKYHLYTARVDLQW